MAITHPGREDEAVTPPLSAPAVGDRRRPRHRENLAHQVAALTRRVEAVEAILCDLAEGKALPADYLRSLRDRKTRAAALERRR